MGASAISVEAVVAATLLLSVVTLLISPFSAILVFAGGLIAAVFLLVWGRRAASGDVEGEADTPTRPRAKGAAR